jgi:hypothetical protein
LDTVDKTVTCGDCHGGQPIASEKQAADFDHGHAGASAGREHARRKTNRETRVREAHPHLGGLLLWLQDAPQHEVAFKTGKLGEVGVGKSLERRTAEGPRSSSTTAGCLAAEGTSTTWRSRPPAYS